MKTTSARHELHPAAGRALVALLGLNILTLIPWVPWWITIVAIGLLAWRWQMDRKGFSPPPFFVKAGLSFLLSALVFFEHKSFFGYEAATSLLLMLGCFKLSESVRVRDMHVIVLVSWLLAGCLQLLNQSTQNIILGVLLVLTGALVLRLLNDPRLVDWNLVQSSRRILKLFLLGLPVGALVFLVFPRISIKTFGIELRPPSQTGFSDEVDPGSVAEIAQADTPVMRVKFIKSRPEFSALYWRGAILDHSEGLRWTRKEKAEIDGPGSGEQGVEQLITLEPQSGNWMFGLDFPVHVEWVTPQPETRLNLDSDQLVRPSKAIGTRVVYRVRSHPEPEAQGDLDLELTKRFTQVEGADRFPKTLALAEEFAAKYKNPEELAHQLMLFFRDNGYLYTLKPGVIPDDSLDYFLFQRKKGFCEHYAAAYGTIMRLAGIPTRVVVGYNGAEFNDVGKYFVVRSRDAHAWTEAFIRGKGWIRYDPVRAIAPERIERGAKEYFESLGLSGNWSSVLGSVTHGTWFAKSWSRLTATFDALDYRVTQFLLEFSLDQQLEVLGIIGLSNEYRLALALATLGILGLGIAIMRILKEREDRPRDAMIELLVEAKRRIQSGGIDVTPHAGPRSLTLLLQDHDPNLAGRWRDWLLEWEQWRYGSRAPSRQKVRDLRRILRKI